MKPKRKKAQFLNREGETLAGLLETPESPHAYALFAHCFTCSKDIAAASRISRALAGRGIATLRFDFTGLGNSDGDFANTNFSSNVADLVAAADYLRSEYQAPGMLIGHSLGGAAVLAAAGQIAEAKAVVTIGAPSDPGHVAHLFADHMDDIHGEGSAEVHLGGRRFHIKKQFLDDISSTSLEGHVAQLKKALLIFHAPFDDTVSIDEAGRIYARAKHPKSFISLDNADHLLTKKADSEYVAATIGAWVGRYLPAPEEEKAPTRPRPAKGEVEVRDRGTGFTQEVASHRHDWTADEPAEYGGADTGPNPYEILLSALGACTSMTLRMYANRKKLELTRIQVNLVHERIHAEDCEACESESGLVDHIVKTIRIDGDLTQTQRERLLQIAERCPVNRTLHNELLIESKT